MGKFGWDLPPGCSTRDIDNAMGTDTPEDCYICKEPLSEDNDTGICPLPKDCAGKMEKMQRDADEAEVASLKETDRWEREYLELRKQELAELEALNGIDEGE